MGLPTLGCKAGVGDGAEVLSCIFKVDCDWVSREREAYVRRRGGMSNAKSTILSE